MEMDQVLTDIRTFEGMLELAPTAGSPYPEIAWGDHFFYYAPDGQVPQREQPYATIVTKDYPDDSACALDAPGRWRLNIHVNRRRFVAVIGEEPRAAGDPADWTVTDVLLPHPIHRDRGWIAVVNPGRRTWSLGLELLREAHDAARRRAERRSASQSIG